MRRWASASLLITACVVPNPLARDEDGASESTEITDGTATSTEPGTQGPSSTTEESTLSSEASEDGTTASTSSGDPLCPADHRCIAAPPPEWTGPVVLRIDALGAEPPACPSDYPELVVSGGQEPSDTEFDCECVCGPAESVTCSSAALRHYTTANCQSAPLGTYTIPPPNCVNAFMALPTGSRFVVEPVSVTGGSCNASLNEFRGEPFFARTATVCGGVVDAGTCANEALCVPIPPEPFGTTTCIVQEGEHECPSAYPDASLLYKSDFSDDRRCAGCSCSAPVGTCSGFVQLYPNDTCAGASIATIPATTTCTPGSASYAHEAARWEPSPPSASCLPSGGEEMGELTPLGPVTVCCASAPG